MIYTKNKIEKAINDGYIVIDPSLEKSLKVDFAIKQKKFFFNPQ